MRRRAKGAERVMHTVTKFSSTSVPPKEQLQQAVMPYGWAPQRAAAGLRR